MYSHAQKERFTDEGTGEKSLFTVTHERNPVATSGLLQWIQQTLFAEFLLVPVILQMCFKY